MGFLEGSEQAPSGGVHARILRATFWIGAITLGTRLLGLVKNQVIAARFGSGAEVEAFFLALAVPTFIIGEDQDGSSLEYSCDPDELANYFGANPNAPHYVTPVFFRRDVLQKYYEDTDKYAVEDGYLRCGGLWGVRIDNDQPDYVMVFLGDLRRDLPAAERDYWRSFNIAPVGPMSETAFRRSFLAPGS